MNSEEDNVKKIIRHYYDAFSKKTYHEENDDYDILMKVYGITPELKRENRQYWGRELGMLWQRLVVAIAKQNCSNFQPAIKYGDDEPCDLVIGQDAIDTKYRIGSGDSGTLKKFKQYGKYLSDQGYRPVFLILRTDNLPTAISAAKKGGWSVYTGAQSIDYIEQVTGVNIENLLKKYEGKYILSK